MSYLARRLAFAGFTQLERAEGPLHRTSARLSLAASNRLEADSARVEQLARAIQHLDPRQVLRRGYSITRLGGRAQSRAGAIHPGDCLVTELYEGVVASVATAKEAESAP